MDPTERSAASTAPNSDASFVEESAEPSPPPPPDREWARKVAPSMRSRAGKTQKRSSRWVPIAITVALIAVIGVASATLLGKNSSSKFSSVAYACQKNVLPGDPWRIVPGQMSGGCGGGTSSSDASGSSGGGGGFAAQSGSPSGRSSAGVTAPSPAPSPGAAAPSAPQGAKGAPAGAEGASYAVDALDSGPAAAGHAFVSTATLTVQVKDGEIGAKKHDAILRAESVGGGLFGEDSSFNGAAKATVTLKVPPEKFSGLLDDFAQLGDLQVQQVKTDDVTQQVIDLDARISAAQDGLDRARGLLSKATNLADVANLEADVARRQTEVESLRGQQKTLAERVDLATIVLTLQSTPAPVVAETPPPPPPPPEAKPLPGFLDGLSGGWKVFTNVGTVVLAVIGAALPFLPLVLVALVVWWALRRRRRMVGPPTPAAGATY